uniref:Large ribosomal subunit protein uL4c n=1 Tax=Cyanidiococcus yangmingshanensis TaxID=2690220 RepID=A0A7G5VUL4_9RHOD|nr:50S ribosomal protein L4 [Cyanidiococcus yangmingshanensis]QMX77381.1 50S ribosomal protein L4 [Cyanidiococcus yangmingshanensis]UNJ15996.1 ribosomal protein L4 [Cyanidioschyzonaceae sp. 3]WDB00513.1 ribosomal protein L4 [Cyanidiococcus yangmingshanensis]
MKHLLHRALRTHLLSIRQWGACTKTRAEVRGGGRKPWKQKGTGRARAGSRRSPLWRGGGVAFGPRAVPMHLKINRKEAHKAVKVALIASAAKMQIIDPPLLAQPSCQTISHMLPATNVLWIVDKKHVNLWLSCRNIKTLHLIQAQHIYVKPLLWAKEIWISHDAMHILEAQYQIKFL